VVTGVQTCALPICLLPIYRLQLNRSTAIVNDILQDWIIGNIYVLCVLCVRVRRGSKDSIKGWKGSRGLYSFGLVN